MATSLCAHCGESSRNPRDSMDYGRAVRCPACGELVCPSCRAKSGPTVCGSFADGDENMREIRRTESKRQRAVRAHARMRGAHS